ncbi:hypothetical protein [Streptacidiphilus sp. PAMC 29251]
MDAQLDPDGMPGFAAPACTKPGTVRHTLIVMPNDSAGSSDRGPIAKMFLEARGWRFGPWVTLPNAGQVPYTYAFGTHGDYRLKILYLNGQHTAVVTGISACFPGKPVTAPSEFPGSVARTP